MSTTELPDTPSNTSSQSSSSRPILILLGIFGCSICLCCTVVVGATGALAGIIAVFATNSATETETQSLRLEPNDARIITIEGGNIGVRIVGSDDASQVEVSSEITAYGLTTGMAEDSLEDISVQVERDSVTGLAVSLNNDASGFIITDATVTLTMPNDMDTIVIDVGDSVEINNTTADFEIVSGGDITLRRVGGIFDVTTDFSLNDISFEGAMEPSQSHRFETNNGDISIIFTQLPSLDYTARTGRRTSGSSSSNSTRVGSVDCPPDAVVEQFTCQGRLGDGTGTLEVISQSGDITIQAP